MNTTTFERTAWIKGAGFQCEGAPSVVSHPWRIILLGAPGVGKGTQAELLSSKLGACHLSTGDIFRSANSLPAEQRDPGLTSALDLMRHGELVPNQIVVDIIRKRLRCLHCRGGFLLDGFPRTVSQADSLQQLLRDENVPLSAVINYEIDLDEIIKRLSGRLSCSKCGASYHRTTNPPLKPDVCNCCHESLYVREDDQPDIIRNRLLAYQKTVEPLLDFYQTLGYLITVKADGAPTEILQRTLSRLQAPGQ